MKTEKGCGVKFIIDFFDQTSSGFRTVNFHRYKNIIWTILIVHWKNEEFFKNFIEQMSNNKVIYAKLLNTMRKYAINKLMAWKES